VTTNDPAQPAVPVLIRPAGPADAPALSEVASATFALACPPHTSPDAIADFIAKTFTVEKFDGYLADPLRVLFLATHAETAIGYALLVLDEPSDPNVASSITLHPTCELSKLYVRPGHHGSGVSANLVAACVDAARSAGRAGMWLGVNEENQRANRFYEKNGFVRVGTKQFLVGERLEDDFVRERPL
jgi:ribosomal protein S18 acetylase RimI-like enzyme